MIIPASYPAVLAGVGVGCCVSVQSGLGARVAIICKSNSKQSAPIFQLSHARHDAKTIPGYPWTIRMGRPMGGKGLRKVMLKGESVM